MLVTAQCVVGYSYPSLLLALGDHRAGMGAPTIRNILESRITTPSSFEERAGSEFKQRFKDPRTPSGVLL